MSFSTWLLGWIQHILASLGLMAGLSCVVGCEFGKLDITSYGRALAESERNSMVASFSGRLLDDPALADKVILLPTVPGKDLDWTWTYPASEGGGERMRLSSKRSPVLDMAWTGASQADLQKFAEQAAQREFFRQEREAWFGVLREIANRPEVQQAAQQKLAASTQPKVRDDPKLERVLNMLEQFLVRQGIPQSSTEHRQLPDVSTARIIAPVESYTKPVRVPGPPTRKDSLQVRDPRQMAMNAWSGRLAESRW